GALPALLTFAVCIAAWEIVSLSYLPVFFPGPAVLVERMVEIYGDPASYVVVGETLARIFEGFVASMLIGTALGLLMGLRRNIEIFFDSWIMVLLTFPAVCWAFLTVLWFGLSQAAAIVTIVLIVFPFVALNIWSGTKAIEKDLVEMSRVYKADRGLMLVNWFQETRVDMMLAWGLSFMIIMVFIDLVVFRTWARRAFAWRPQVA